MPLTLKLRIPRILTQLRIVIIVLAELRTPHSAQSFRDCIIDLSNRIDDVGNDAGVSDQVGGCDSD